MIGAWPRLSLTLVEPDPNATNHHDRCDRLCPALHGAAAAGALHPYPVVPEEVPVLRLQFARAEGSAARGALCRRAYRRSRIGAAAGLGPQADLDLLRRWH